MKKTTLKPTRSQLSALRQLCNLIPNRLVSDLAAQTVGAPKARTFSYWSQTTALIYAQLVPFPHPDLVLTSPARQG